MYVDSEVIDAAEKTARHLAKKHKERLLNKDTMRSFWLQELEGASSGDNHARKWVKSKGVDPSRYKGALMDDNLDAEKIQMDAAVSSMIFPHEDKSVYKCLLVDNLMKESEELRNASKRRKSREYTEFPF